MPVRHEPNLLRPRSRNPIIGRERELAELRGLLLRDDIALVTLLGPGGVGKTRLALRLLRAVPGIRVLGPTTAKDRGGVFAFALKGVHPHDLATFLDAEGIAVRAGHHCTQPLHDRFGIPATTRASFGVYTTEAEVRRFVTVLTHIAKRFGRA